MKVILITFFICIVSFIANNYSYWTLTDRDVIFYKQESNKKLSENFEKQNSYMKVNFYIFNVNQSDKGDFLGTAELKDGKLKVDVTDSNLREILESPYETMAGEFKNGTAYDWIVTYQPGTLEHLRAIVVECWSYGYVAEIINSD